MSDGVPTVATAHAEAAGDRHGPAFALTPPAGWSRRGGHGYQVLTDAASDERLGFAFSTARGLEEDPPTLEFRWLYDENGSRIFERITEQPEYYPTRTEDEILARAARPIRDLVGAAALAELGSGSSRKTRRLLDAWCGRGPSRYLPIDVSSAALEPACRALAGAYPGLTVEGIAATYDRGLPLLDALSPLCLCFLGSSIGNFGGRAFERFLETIAAALQPRDHLLVGLDLVKDPRTLEAAYNDAAGWSAAFTRNLFARMNRQLGTAVDLSRIEHVAWYDHQREQIDIRARFLDETVIELGAAGRSFRFPPGAMVRTEVSRKFRLDGFARDAARFRLDRVAAFEDPEQRFALLLLERRAPAPSHRPPDERARLASMLAAVRRRTHELVAPLSDGDLVRQHSPLMSPLVWDLAHIARYEELWLLASGGAVPALAAAGNDAASPDVFDEGLPAELDALRTPRAARGALDLPRPAAAMALLAGTRAAVEAQLAAAPAERLRGEEGYLYRMVGQHEAQHQETMLAALQLRHDLIYAPSFAVERQADAAGDPAIPTDTILVPAGPFRMGTDDREAAYDNERPGHEVVLPAFRIDAAPVTNAAWQRFLDDGGYRRAELWSADGWRWRCADDAIAPGHWVGSGAPWMVRRFGRLAPPRPDEPVLHVSWFEADAYARWAGRRLPTEAEWEKAAAWDAETRRARRYPWGDEEPSALHANLGGRLLGPAPAGSLPAGRSFYGCHQMLGDAWEWTSSCFQPYPGFIAHPYRGYSAAFFGSRYRVLRGGSWATLPIAARCTFRNWDFPERRQVFAGLRCCQDA